MATTGGKQSSPVDDPAPLKTILRLLEEEPFRVHFFQAVRLLQRMDRERKPVGHFFPPQEELLRFSSLPSLAFPASELFNLERQPNGQLKMTVQFMGLCAALSALPSTYTEVVLTRIREKDNAMAEFFDIFNHRLLAFFYRAWEKHRFYIGYERREDDRLSLRLLDLLGLGTEKMRGRATISDRSCIYYAGLLGRHVRTADSLRQILEDFFDVPVKIHQFAGTWRRLPRENQTFLSGVGDVSEQLGIGVVAGEEVWDHHGRIQITLGPMDLEEYQQFLPGQAGYRELAAWMQFYSDGSYETEVQLILRGAEIPACGLGRPARGAARLGLVSWLKTKPRLLDAGEATFLLG